jgi:hypothetical protein
MSLVLEVREVQRILKGLLNRNVKVALTDATPEHPATRRALVNDDDALVAVIAADLAFAHRTGAALALMPPGTVVKVGEEPDEDLMENYIEVANVLSRVVNEASRARVRIDPGLEVPPQQMQALISACGCTAFEVEVEDYGSGNVAVWHG